MQTKDCSGTSGCLSSRQRIADFRRARGISAWPFGRVVGAGI